MKGIAIGILALLLAAGTASAATLTVCNYNCTYSSIQAAVDAASNGDTIHDVAVTGIYANPTAEKGTIVGINYSVKNEGTANETFNVTVSDSTDGVTICLQTFALAPNETSGFGCNWNTSTATIGNHTIVANATQVPGETDLADNVKTTVVTITEPSPPQVYNGTITSLTTDKPKYLRGQTVYATATVQNTGNQVLNATVEFTYLKPDMSQAYTQNNSVSVPVGGAVNTTASYTLLSKATLGNWTVKAELFYGGQILSTKTTTFQVANKL